jgi:hypothetical protein
MFIRSKCRNVGQRQAVRVPQNQEKPERKIPDGAQEYHHEQVGPRAFEVGLSVF